MRNGSATGRLGGIIRDSVFQAIVLGTLITVAAFFATRPEYSQIQNGEAYNSEINTNNEIKERLFGISPEGWTAIFTGALAVFTLVLVGVSSVQIYFLTKADETGRISANAAEIAANAAILNAKAAIGAEMPIVSVAAISLMREDQPRARAVDGYPGKESIFTINFKNFGRSPAEMICICIEWAVVDVLPSAPIYKTISPYAPGIFIEPGNMIPNGPIKIKICLQDDETAALSDERRFLWVFGYVSFKDVIVGERHTVPFCAKWQAYAARPDGELRAMGFVYDSETPAQYTNRS